MDEYRVLKAMMWSNAYMEGLKYGAGDDRYESKNDEAKAAVRNFEECFARELNQKNNNK